MSSGTGFGRNDLLHGGNSSVKVFYLERTYADPVQLVINKQVPGIHGKGHLIASYLNSSKKTTSAMAKRTSISRRRGNVTRHNFGKCMDLYQFGFGYGKHTVY